MACVWDMFVSKQAFSIVQCGTLCRFNALGTFNALLGECSVLATHWCDLMQWPGNLSPGMANVSCSIRCMLPWCAVRKSICCRMPTSYVRTPFLTASLNHPPCPCCVVAVTLKLVTVPVAAKLGELFRASFCFQSTSLLLLRSPLCCVCTHSLCSWSLLYNLYHLTFSVNMRCIFYSHLLSSLILFNYYVHHCSPMLPI